MNANTVILFNGRAGSGKTACARALFERLGSCALLDVDSLTTVEPFIWGNELSVLGLKNAADVIANFFDYGFSQVVFSGGVHSQDLVNTLTQLLPSKTTLHYVWIDAEKSVRQQRRDQRARDGADAPEWQDFIDGLAPYPGPMEISGGKYMKIDTNHLHVREVAQAVIDGIGEDSLITRSG